MAEIEQNGRPVGGLPEAHPREAQIREQNAARIARRAAAAAAFHDVQRVSGSNLDRFGETRKIGGRFEKIQKVPKRKTPAPVGLNERDLLAFLSAFNFGGKDVKLGSKSFLSSFGPFVLGLNK
jgi:hypothetical protein